MSARRRRGRRRHGEQRDGSGQQGQPRMGPNGPIENQPRGPGIYTGQPSGQPRWQPRPGGQGQRRFNNTGAHGNSANVGYGQGGQPGNQQGRNRRWGPGQGQYGQGQGQYGQGQRGRGQRGQGQRWGRGGRPQRPAGQHDQQRRPEAPSMPPGGEIDPFDLFCAYHLGITAEDGYRIQNIHEVARRFGTDAAALRQTLAAYGMDADDIVHSGFDLPSAQIDIMVAPEGISRRELARPLYDEFKKAPRKVRDWAREMAEAGREIDRTLGRDGAWSPAPRDRAGKQS